MDRVESAPFRLHGHGLYRPPRTRDLPLETPNSLLENPILPVGFPEDLRYIDRTACHRIELAEYEQRQ